MTALRRLTTAIAALLPLAAVALLAATAAARPAPPDDGNGLGVPPAPATIPTSTIVHTGSPWWTFVLVAAAAIAATILMATLVNRLRHTHPVRVVAH